MDSCTQTQEKLAGGARLAADEQLHAAGCARCATVASAYSLLDATLEAVVPALAIVPPGFADRVMARLAADAEPPPARWLDRRWLQLAFAHGAALCAVFNLARFVVRIFVSDVALGGTP